MNYNYIIKSKNHVTCLCICLKKKTKFGFGFGLASELQKSKGGEVMVVEWQIGE